MFRNKDIVFNRIYIYCYILNVLILESEFCFIVGLENGSEVDDI